MVRWYVIEYWKICVVKYIFIVITLTCSGILADLGQFLRHFNGFWGVLKVFISSNSCYCNCQYFP